MRREITLVALIKSRNLIILFFVIAHAAGILAQDTSSWQHSSGNSQGTRHALDSQINSQNVNNLKSIWTYSSGDIATNTVQSSPIFTGSKLVSVTALGNVIALNPETGKLIWKTYIGIPAGRRGITSAFNNGLKIFVPNGEGVVELDEESGKIIHTYPTEIALVAPVIHQNKMIVATLEDGIKAYDINSKELIWHLSLEKNNVSPRIWSGFSFEPSLNMAYVVTGSSNGLTGRSRELSDHSVSLIAIDVETGSLDWSFQHIPHDVWDLDMVGSPMVISNHKQDNNFVAVVALSKTGDILFFNARTGAPVFPNSFKNQKVMKSELRGENLSPYQKVFFKPEPYADIIVDKENDFNHLNPINKKFLDAKLRNAKFGFYVPPSINYDVVMYGLHGGVNWFGGSIDQSSHSNELVIPYNRDPWILRVFHQDNLHNFLVRAIQKINRTIDPSSLSYISPWEKLKTPQSQLADKIYTKMPFTPSNQIFLEDCSSCHGVARQGAYQDESEGDQIYPPLVGLSFSHKMRSVSNSQKLQSLHREFDISIKISDEDYQEMLLQFKKYDEKLLKFNMLGYSSFWQILLDKDGYPATKPPWGGIAKINLESGSTTWKKKFGKRIDEDGNTIADGDKNFGGLMTTKSGLIFSTGTPDKFIYAIDTKSGKELWKYQLPYAGSAPPISYMFNGCQYIVTQATGGVFVGFEAKKGDMIAAFKLETC